MIDRDLIKRALAEDLQGGQDITSVATVSGSEEVVADFVSRKAGVVAGIDMARAVLEEVGLTDIEVLALAVVKYNALEPSAKSSVSKFDKSSAETAASS